MYRYFKIPKIVINILFVLLSAYNLNFNFQNIYLYVLILQNGSRSALSYIVRVTLKKIFGMGQMSF